MTLVRNIFHEEQSWITRLITNVPPVSTVAKPCRTAPMPPGLFALATGTLVVGAVALVLAVVSGVVDAAWLVYAHRRVRNAELRWRATHSDEPAPPPSS
jgi:ABC-type phosphate transport system permease subunit